jgi:hypothetical protein
MRFGSQISLIAPCACSNRGTTHHAPSLPPHLTKHFKLETSMKTFVKFAFLAAVGGVLAVFAASPASAHTTRHHHRHHVRVHYGYGSYAYAPRRHWSGSSENERRCMLSPASQEFEPCMNKR